MHGSSSQTGAKFDSWVPRAPCARSRPRDEYVPHINLSTLCPADARSRAAGSFFGDISRRTARFASFLRCRPFISHPQPALQPDPLASTSRPTACRPTCPPALPQVLRPPAPARGQLPQEEVRPHQPAAPQEEAQVSGSPTRPGSPRPAASCARAARRARYRQPGRPAAQRPPLALLPLMVA